MILHLAPNEKFIPAYIKYVGSFANPKHHVFVICGKSKYNGNYAGVQSRILFLKSDFQMLSIVQQMFNANIIIHHGLFSPWVLLTLSLFPILRQKSRWVVWGGDLYLRRALLVRKGLKPKIFELLRRMVLGRVKWLITYVPGDVTLAREWYGNPGRYLHCLMYPSNTYDQDVSIAVKHEGPLVIQVGNSADVSNEHAEVFYRLAQLKDQTFHVICPLSYGNPDYADDVDKLGSKLFGQRYHSLRKFLSLSEYQTHLADIDVAIFGHHRQQAMGNIITLLGMGKLVYLRSDISSWQVFKDCKVYVGDLLEEIIDLSPKVRLLAQQENPKKIIRNFNNRALCAQLKNVFAQSPEFKTISQD